MNPATLMACYTHKSWLAAAGAGDCKHTPPVSCQPYGPLVLGPATPGKPGTQRGRSKGGLHIPRHPSIFASFSKAAAIPIFSRALAAVAPDHNLQAEPHNDEPAHQIGLCTGQRCKV